MLPHTATAVSGKGRRPTNDLGDPTGGSLVDAELLVAVDQCVLRGPCFPADWRVSGHLISTLYGAWRYHVGNESYGIVVE